MGSTHYQILGVAESASLEEIKSAYKKLAMRYHPDRTGGNTTLEDHFKKVTAAYHILSHAERKRQYDTRLAQSRIKKSNPTPPRPRPSPDGYSPPVNRKTSSTGRSRSKANQPIPTKYYGFTLLIFMVIVVAGLAFYRVMNLYTAQVRLEEGLAFESKENFIQAILSYTEAIRFNPELWEPFYRRGMVYIKALKNYESALPDLKQAALKSELNHAEIYYQVGLCHLALKQGELALVALDKSIQSDSSFVQSYYALGEAHAFYLDTYEQSLPYFRKSLEFNPQNADATFGMAYALYKLRKMEAAQEWLQKTINQDTDYKDAYLIGAEIFLSQADTANACLQWQKLLALGDESAKNALLNYCR